MSKVHHVLIYINLSSTSPQLLFNFNSTIPTTEDVYTLQTTRENEERDEIISLPCGHCFDDMIQSGLHLV